MALPPSTANWHWKNKNVTSWAKAWFERELQTIIIKGDGEEFVSVSKVTDVDGDVELGQRKSKLITIYDCKIELKWTGTASDGTEVDGSLSIPEVSHEITLDGISEYSYVWRLSTSSSPAVDALFQLAKQRIPTALEAKFAEFPSALIENHGKDLTVSATASAEASRGGTPAPSESVASTSASAPKASPAPAPKAVKKQAINTTDITVEAIFMASADDLFSIFTDEKRIPSWTRAPAKSKPEPGFEYSLFGGGVSGKYISVEPARKIVQSWRLSSAEWPSDHQATLTTTFDQQTDSTTVILKLEGVPIGMQDETKRNLEGYYVQGLKSIGYVRLLPYESPPRSLSINNVNSLNGKQQVSDTAASSRNNQFVALLFAALALAAAFFIPFFSHENH